MEKKKNNFLITFLFLFVMVLLSISGQWLICDTPNTPNQQVLPRVEVPGMLNNLELPVYAHMQHMQDVTGGDYTNSSPVVDFIGIPTTVIVGGSVAFTALCTSNPGSLTWSFEGGIPRSSTAQNPTVIYNTVGTYDVSLTVTNDQGSDTETKVGYITVIPYDDIADALDCNLTFIKSGDADWFRVVEESDDYAKSGLITHSQSTSIETTFTVAAPSSAKFYWKVSSEAGYDFLRFYIDGVLKSQISGEVAWTQVSYNIAAGTHTLKWTYIKDRSISSGSDCGCANHLVIETPPDPIAEAVDCPDLIFTLSGNANWFAQTGVYYYDNDAAQSGAIGDNQYTTMETTISGKTSIKFWWIVSSEANYDFLKFYIDDVLMNSISGSPNWAQKSYTVTTGFHTLKWTYIKDASVASGSDAGWVDKLELL